MLWMSQARHIEIQITQTFTPFFYQKWFQSTCTLSAWKLEISLFCIKCKNHGNQCVLYIIFSKLLHIMEDNALDDRSKFLQTYKNKLLFIIRLKNQYDCTV